MEIFGEARKVMEKEVYLASTDEGYKQKVFASKERAFAWVSKCMGLTEDDKWEEWSDGWRVDKNFVSGSVQRLSYDDKV